jgi:adenine-specific DNA-methyltransferase
MDKLKMQTPNLIDKNIEQIANLFPNVITEIKDDACNSKKAIDFDLLKQCLSNVLVAEENERYRLDWPGKKASLLKANSPINKTLRPCREESVDFDTTENVYIEGDNFEVLKILQESYLGKIKMIYIDPPYNTGNDFIYKDNFEISKEEYEEEIGAIGEDRDRLFKNTDSNGRFHSDWISMMYERLVVARDLLKDDGLIFISIDDSEVDNLKKICNEIYGEANFLAQLIWQNKKGGGNDSTHIAIEHEYIISYAKNKSNLHEFYESYSEEYAKRYKESDNIGRYYWDTFKRKSGKQYYPIECPDGTILEYDDDGNAISWLRSEPRFKTDMLSEEIRFVKNGDKWSVQFKQRMPIGKKPRSIFITDNLLTEQGTTSSGSDDVFAYFKKDVFSNPKPVKLLTFLMGFGLSEEDIILDFFSGSGTVAEAVMRSNISDNGNRTYIAIQLQENVELALKSSSANAKRVAENAIQVLYELKFPTLITELAKERIRRAGEKIKEELDEKNKQLKLGVEPIDTAKLDIGFRVYKTDSTNMKDVYYHPEELQHNQLSFLESNIKEDRTPDDLLAQVILDLGLELSLPIQKKEILGSTIFVVQTNALIACFDDNINFKIVDEIAKIKPFKVVFKDASFKNDKDRINVEERFKRLSPETAITVI